MRDYSKRDKKEYNVLRAIFQWLTVKVAYSTWYKIAHGLKVYGRENVPKNQFVIVASNHLSAIDPFLVIDAIGHPAAYMAKKELFENSISRLLLNWLGAFAVNRDKLGVSTIKTALSIKETGWFLALFPQGTRVANNDTLNYEMGFVKIAKILKCPVLPVGIIGTQKENRKLLGKKMSIRIGKPIPFNEDVNLMAEQWAESIKELTDETKKPKLNIEKYKKKKAKDFNILTYLYQIYASHVVFRLFSFPFYKFKYINNKKIDRKKQYIYAPNHTSYLDVFLMGTIFTLPVAFMAKKELFESSKYVAKNIARLGAFPVNREKLEKSTIKTASEVVSKTKFNLCIFPQGGIRKNKKIEDINPGFIFFAKLGKRDILPISITGLEEYNWNIFKRKKVNVEIGTPISYLKSDEEILQEWKEQISKMSGYEIVQ